MKTIYQFLISIHHKTSNKNNIIKHLSWRFYDKNNNLITLNHEFGYIKTHNKYYKFKKWYICDPDLKIIKNIKEFVKVNKIYLQKMNSFIKNNYIIINKLNWLLKPFDRFVIDNFYGWKKNDDFYLKIDIYKSPFLDTIYIKTGNMIYNYDKCINYKTLFKILREIDIINFIKNHCDNNNVKNENITQNKSLSINDITDTFDNLEINKVDKNIDYDEIRNESPQLFIKLSNEKKLTVQSCKNSWDFIESEQTVN